MTVPPLPETPCLKVALDYTQTDGYDAGSRFFLSYAGAAPTPGNCSTLASDISAAWNTHLAPQVNETFALTKVDVLDIATYSGNFGEWTGDLAGGDSGTQLPAQSATNIEFNIQRRYRGGKPRMFLPPPTTGAQLDAGHFTTTFIGNTNTAMAAFIAEIEALSIGAVGALAHVNLSYYQSFKNVENSSGRMRAAPTYRATALVDTITGYATKGLIGSQKRRRAATTA